jgi:cag pathogenicity island protein 24|tara:strand:+ start:16319 stop:16789 length:471 start_codon:yes stop_codon:yes gene_type:complete
MKYRLLTKEEREIFDEDFKHFMISNGVTNEEWLEMNESNLEKATELVELFSDLVLEKVYQKIEYLEFRSENSCLVFHCTPDTIKLISILPKTGKKVNLSTPESIHEALINQFSDLDLFKSEKGYATLRELEIHQMVEQGCLNSSKDFWNALTQLIN